MTEWQNLSSFYEDFLQYPDWQYIRAFLPFVQQLLESRFPCTLYCHTSHSILCITCVGDYPDWFDYPMVGICPIRTGVEISRLPAKCHGNLKRVDIITCGYDAAWSTVLPLLECLEAYVAELSDAQVIH